MDYPERSHAPKMPESIWARRTLWAALIFFPAILVTLPPALNQVFRHNQRGKNLILWASLISLGQIVILLGLIWAAAFWISQNPNYADVLRGLI